MRGAKSHCRSQDADQLAEFRSQELNSLPGNTSEEVDADVDAEEIVLRPGKSVVQVAMKSE